MVCRKCLKECKWVDDSPNNPTDGMCYMCVGVWIRGKIAEWNAKIKIEQKNKDTGCPF